MKTKLLKKLRARFIWTWVPVTKAHRLVYDRREVVERRIVSDDVLRVMCDIIGVHYISRYTRNAPRRKRALKRKYEGITFIKH